MVTFLTRDQGCYVYSFLADTIHMLSLREISCNGPGAVQGENNAGKKFPII
jgi:hypothetical protein